MIDRDRLVTLMQRFESGDDLDPDNPFGEPTNDVLEMLPIMGAFLEVVVRDTKNFGSEDPLSFAVAGFLQGLAIGHAYARG